MRTPLLGWSGFAAAFLVSCIGTDVGNPPDDERTVIAALEFATYEGTSEDDAAAAPADGTAGENARQLIVEGDTDISSLWLSIDSIVVTPAADCRPQAERTIEGPFYVDLLDGEVYPAAPILTEVPEEYCGLRLQLAPAKEIPAEAPASLSGKSLWLQGTTQAGANLSIAVSARRGLNYFGESFVVDGEDGAQLRFIAAFEPSGWLDDIDVSVDTPVELDEVGSSSDLAAFWSAFATGSRVVLDEDDDGAVSASEFERPVAIPRDPPN